MFSGRPYRSIHKYLKHVLGSYKTRFCSLFGWFWSQFRKAVIQTHLAARVLFHTSTYIRIPMALLLFYIRSTRISASHSDSLKHALGKQGTGAHTCLLVGVCQLDN